MNRFGLAWSPLKKGHILGSSEDMTVCHWCAKILTDSILILVTNSPPRDVNMYSKGKNIEPLAVYSGHKSVVGVRIVAPKTVKCDTEFLY